MQIQEVNKLVNFTEVVLSDSSYGSLYLQLEDFGNYFVIGDAVTVSFGPYKEPKPDGPECERCHGSGWLWRDEIDPEGYHEEAMSGGCFDDTRYRCPNCRGTGVLAAIDDEAEEDEP